MSKKSDKKTMLILLAILALVTIGGGFWTYQNLQPVDIDDEFAAINNEQFDNVRIDEVFRIKNEVLDNVDDFLDINYIDFKPGTIWDDFYSNPQLERLNDVEINIDIENYKNNPNPFLLPTSTDDGREEGIF